MRPRFGFGRGKGAEAPEDVDATAWLVQSSMAEFLLLHTVYIKYMVMFGYTYLHGCKLFGTLPPNSSVAYKYVSMIFQCTGGGVIVPLLINYIPVPIGIDAYPIVITISFLLHFYVPILRDVTKQSLVLKGCFIVLYETMRAAVVCKFIHLANEKIPASDFSIPVFGPIFCGTIAGCGGSFIPFNKGLDAIKEGTNGPMASAFAASIVYHLLVNTESFSQYLQAEVERKAQVLMALFFIAYHFSTDFHPLKQAPTTSGAKKQQ